MSTTAVTLAASPMPMLLLLKPPVVPVNWAVAVDAAPTVVALPVTTPVSVALRVPSAPTMKKLESEATSVVFVADAVAVPSTLTALEVTVELAVIGVVRFSPTTTVEVEMPTAESVAAMDGEERRGQEAWTHDPQGDVP